VWTRDDTFDRLLPPVVAPLTAPRVSPTLGRFYFLKEYFLMTFSEAVAALQADPKNAKVKRTGWGTSKLWVALVEPTPGGPLTAPLLILNTDDNEQVPWLISYTDVLTNDWEVPDLTKHFNR